MSPHDEGGTGPVAHQASPNTTQDRTATTQITSRDHDTATSDRKAAYAELGVAISDLIAHPGDGRLLDRLDRHATRLRPHVDAGRLHRAALVSALAMAASAAGVSTASAEAAVLTALNRGAE